MLHYASTFTDSLHRLSSSEQKQVKITVFDLSSDPTGNGLRLHRVAASDGFWTARVTKDVRLVLHKDGPDTLIAWVGHHDDAYRWAERRRLVPHERTGAMQLVEVVEATVGRRQLAVGGEQPSAVDEATPPPGATANRQPPTPTPFSSLSDDQLLDVGVPRDWLQPVRDTGADELFDLLASLPDEAAEALLDHATGGRLADHVAPQTTDADPFAHPDAQRRFRTVDDLDELRAALDRPFAQWAVFLHPAQRALVHRAWTGPARVTGTAGTGKTVVALHRAAALAADPDARVLLTTFSPGLARSLSAKLAVLTEGRVDVAGRITVRALDRAAHDLFAARFGEPDLASGAQVRAAVAAGREAGLGGALTDEFLWEEWTELVDAWGVEDADAYATVPRVGRRTRLGAVQREAAWGLFAFVRRWLAERRRITWPMLYGRLTASVAAGEALPFTHVVVDEAQDLSVAQVRLLAAVAAARPGAVFLAGDGGQRIFHLPFSWAKLGLDVRGRSHRLKVNYRTSHQIRTAADRLLPPSITDADGDTEARGGTTSVFDGPEPDVILADDEAAERARVSDRLRGALAGGVRAEEIGVLVRGRGQLGRGRAIALEAGLDPRATDGVTVATMHEAKGLEFRVVAVAACDDDVLPDPARLSGIGDLAELEAAFETERHLLYVACTRARDRLVVSGVAPGSEFLGDLEERRR